MTLLDQIKRDHLNFRKQRDRINTQVLTTLIGEIEGEAKKGTHTVDQIVTSKLKKFVKDIKFTLEHSAPTDEQRDALLQEMDTLNNYLPRVMTEDQLSKVVAGIIKTLDNPNIGSVMKELKQSHDGAYDGRMASTIVKSLL